MIEGPIYEKPFCNVAYPGDKSISIEAEEYAAGIQGMEKLNFAFHSELIFPYSDHYITIKASKRKAETRYHLRIDCYLRDVRERFWTSEIGKTVGVASIYMPQECVIFRFERDKVEDIWNDFLLVCEEVKNSNKST